MKELDVMMVMDNMAQMFETLIARIEATEHKLAERCSCKKWANDLRPGAVFEPTLPESYLTKAEVEWLIGDEPDDWAEALIEMYRKIQHDKQ